VLGQGRISRGVPDPDVGTSPGGVTEVPYSHLKYNPTLAPGVLRYPPHEVYVVVGLPLSGFTSL